MIPDGPRNTDDRPVVEYLTPISERRVESGGASWFHMEELAGFFKALQREVPAEHDPYLAGRDPEALDYVRAGLSYYEASVLKKLGNAQAAEALFRDFAARLPVELRPDVDEEEIATDFER
jgi:hypothetical protein